MSPEFRLAIEILEDVLNFLYELDYKASHLAKTHAARTAVWAKAS